MPILKRGGNADVSTDDIYRILAGEITPDDIRERRRQRELQRKIGYLQYLREQDFEKKGTRELIVLLRRARWRVISLSDDYMAGDKARIEADRIEATADYWAIKKVLNARPHELSRMEARDRRRDAAKRQHGKGKSKDR